MAVVAMQRPISGPSPVLPISSPHIRPSPVSSQTQSNRPSHMSREKENAVQLKPATINGATNIRSRRERPCDACRRRKSRCVIHEGKILCVLCEFHHQECTFVQSPLPRKRKLPNGNASNGEETKKRSTDEGKRQNRNTSPTPKVLSSHSYLSNHLSKSGSNVAISPNLNRDLENGANKLLGETLGLQRRKFSRYIGQTTPFDPSLISLSIFDTHNESRFDLGTLRKVNDHECFIMLPDECSQEYGEDSEALSAVEQLVHPHGSKLISLYFEIVHPSFPIIQKRIFLERLLNGDPASSPTLLAGMYLLALNWWSHDPTLASLPRPNTIALESIAMRSLAAAMTRPKLNTVQAGLLLLQRPEADSWSLTTQLVAIGQDLGLHLDCSSWSVPAWERGLRKRIAWALYMQDKWSSLIHGRPSHIFPANWAVKPIANQDFDESNSTAVDVGELGITEEELDEAAKGQVLFAEMIGLTAIMGEIMDTFYTQTAIRDFKDAGLQSTQLILERAKPVQIRLKDWFAKLPPAARMDNYQPGVLSGTGFLHLAYFATEITLHRRIVQSLSTLPLPATIASASSISTTSNPTATSSISRSMSPSLNASPTPPTSVPSSTTPSSGAMNPGPSPHIDPYLIYICRSAAKTRLISAMDFVNRLKPEHLQSFWYFPSKINFTLIGTFGSLLWATAPAREEAEFYKHRLAEYRWTLGVSRGKVRMRASHTTGSSEGAIYGGLPNGLTEDGEGFLEGAVRMLDASRTVLSNLAEKPSLAQTAISRAGVPAPEVTVTDLASDSDEDGDFPDVEMAEAPSMNPPRTYSESVHRQTGIPNQHVYQKGPSGRGCTEQFNPSMGSGAPQFVPPGYSGSQSRPEPPMSGEMEKESLAQFHSRDVFRGFETVNERQFGQPK